jgi:hypothetical protein
MGIHSGPWHVMCPRQPSVPGRVHRIQAQDVGLPACWRQPRSGSRPRRLSPHASGEGEDGVEPGANREYGVTPQPLCELPATPLI